MGLGLMVAALLALGGCADLAQWRAGSPQAEALMAHPPAGMPSRLLLDNTPFFPQEDFQCGPAALATVLGAAGVDVAPDALSRQVFTPAAEGSYQVEMLAAARRQGRLAVRVAPQLASVPQALQAGRPVLVLLNPSLQAWPRWHYAVVVGLDVRAGTVTLRSGQDREAVWPLATFDYAWQRSQRWGFVLTAPDAPPRDMGAPAVIEAVTAYARTHPGAAGRPAYDAAVQAWPSEPVLWLGLAQSWSDAGAWPEAVSPLRQAVSLGGGAVALNNLAMALWHSGQATEARQVAEQARARASAQEPRWLSVTEDTWQQVQAPPPP